jgi:hypothetical protein
MNYQKENLMNRTSPAWLSISSRCAAGLVGGYVFTYALTAFLARLMSWLSMPSQDAAIVASLPAFAVYTAAIIWAFATRSAWRAWAGVAMAAPLALVGFWPQLAGA